MSLAKIGSKRITDLDTDSSPEAIECRTHFEQTRDSLLRSHWWGFASARAVLSADTETPEFEWSYQYALPSDFMRLKSIYENGVTNINYRNYAIEGNLLLTDESSMSIRYIKKITDPTKFDELFVEGLVLKLALKLLSLSGADPGLMQVIATELSLTMEQIRVVDAQETNTNGVIESSTWNDAKYTGCSSDPSRY